MRGCSWKNRHSERKEATEARIFREFDATVNVVKSFFLVILQFHLIDKSRITRKDVSKDFPP